MKIITASALGIALVFAASFLFLRDSEARVISFSQSIQPTPPPNELIKELTSPIVSCSPQPPPISDAEKNDPDYREPSPEELGLVDSDCDGICNAADNCLFNYNPDQKDHNKDSKGDACDPKLVDKSFVDARCDLDGDGVPDNKDNCSLFCNPNQELIDVNNNKIHDACDSAIPDLPRPLRACTKRIKVKAFKLQTSLNPAFLYL